MEEQAIDRCHRLGQTRSVEVVRLVVRDSVEEKVCALQRKKKALASDLLEHSEQSGGGGSGALAQQQSRRLGIDEVRSFFA